MQAVHKDEWGLASLSISTVVPLQTEQLHSRHRPAQTQRHPGQQLFPRPEVVCEAQYNFWHTRQKKSDSPFWFWFVSALFLLLLGLCLWCKAAVGQNTPPTRHSWKRRSNAVKPWSNNVPWQNRTHHKTSQNRQKPHSHARVVAKYV